MPGDLKSITFDVHGVTTRVRTNSDQAAVAIEKFLSHFGIGAVKHADIEFHLFFVDSLDEAISPVPASAKLLYDWGMVRVFQQDSCRYLKVENRARVTADVEQRTAAGFAERELLESDWLVTNLFFYPLWAQLLKVNGLFPLHAAGLASGNRASLFLGRSGSGKSTLSLNLVRGGLGLLSDDTVFLREAGDGVEVLSFPEEINVKEETIKLLPELSRIKKFKVNKLRQKSSFSIEELYPGCVVDSSIPAIMVFPEIADSVETSVEPMTGTEALSESLRYGFFFLDPSTTRQHFNIMSLLANQVHCYRLYSGSDQKQLERVVSELLAADSNGGSEAGNDSRRGE